MNQIKAYECEGSLSLSKTYLEKLSGGKFEAKKVAVTMDDATLMKLLDAHENEFNHNLYNTYLEDGKDEVAAEYFVRNARCLSIASYDIHKSITGILEEVKSEFEPIKESNPDALFFILDDMREKYTHLSEQQWDNLCEMAEKLG